MSQERITTTLGLSQEGRLWRFIACLALATAVFGAFAYVMDELLGIG